MKTFKLTIPDTSDIKIGDVIDLNGVKHILKAGIQCYECSLNHNCRKAASNNFCGVSRGAFKFL